MVSTTSLRTTCAALTFGLACAGLPALAGETEAKDIITAMSEYLGSQKTLSFDYESTVEVITTDAQKLSVTSSGSLSMERPDKLHVTRSGGFAQVAGVFDGKAFTVENLTTKNYAVFDAPGSVEQLVEKLRTDLGLVLPAADLLDADVASQIFAQAKDIKDLGSGVIGGTECDHIAFRSDDLDWQLWVAQGVDPYPCRYQVTSRKVDGMPDYTLTVSNWGKGSGKADFAFKPSEGAAKVEIKELAGVDEIAGIYVVKGN